MRDGATVEVHYSLDGATYTLIRQANFTDRPTIDVGLMVCSPIGVGLTAVFEDFAITP